MSYFMRVFCRSRQPITRREIAEFILEGVYFDEPPRFEPPPESPEAADESWGSLTVYYEEDKRPVIFERNVNDEFLRKEIEEVMEVLNKTGHSDTRQDIIERLKATYQVIAIEVDPGSLTEDCWAMIDSVEGYLARKCDGIVYAPDEGFYDAKLQPIYLL